ncbi:hypothetical protein TFLX_05338 [Thermoflexales bacterium]|nr:hypothetical protein TFLX_05338 [Thermoflexales bacterium]
MRFDIVSYLSVGPIRFGINQEELAVLMGRPGWIGKDWLGETDYQYPDFSVRFAKEDHSLVEVGFSPSAKLFFEGIDIFNEHESLTKLLRRDGYPLEFMGFIILLEIGITLTGFHDSDESQKAVTVFAKGRWDELKPSLKPYLSVY